MAGKSGYRPPHRAVSIALPCSLNREAAVGQLVTSSADIIEIMLGLHKTPYFLPRCMGCRRGLAIRILSVRLSVRPSVKRVEYDKTEERAVQVCTPYERSCSLVF